MKSRYFIPKPQVERLPRERIFLLFLKQHLRLQVIKHQSKHETQFENKPRLRGEVREVVEPKPCAHCECKNHRWPADAIPQTALHDFELRRKDITLRFVLYLSFYVVNQQTRHVEQRGEPGNHEDDVEGFYVEHRTKGTKTSGSRSCSRSQ